MGYVIGTAAAALFGWLGYRLSKRRKLAAIGGVLLGLAVAFWWSGRQDYSQGAVLLPLVNIQIPEQYQYETVIFIVDPKASTEIAWSKDGEGHVTAPKNGIIRVKSLGPLEHHDSRAALSDGRWNWGQFDSYLKDGTNFLVFDFAEVEKPPRLDLLSDAEVAEYLRKREAE